MGDASLLADFAEVGRGVDVEQLHDLPLIQIRVVYKLIRWKGKKEVRLAEVKDETFADFFQSVSCSCVSSVIGFFCFMSCGIMVLGREYG